MLSTAGLLICNVDEMMGIWELLKLIVITREHYFLRWWWTSKQNWMHFLQQKNETKAWVQLSLSHNNDLNQSDGHVLALFSPIHPRLGFINYSEQTARYWERFPSPKALWTFQMGRGPSRLNAPSSWHEFLFSRENNGICVAWLSNPSTQDLRSARASPASR